MCCGTDLCCFFGCNSSSEQADKPEGYPEPPRKFLCPYCGYLTNSEYRRDKYSFCICFIPCIPWGNSYPYLSCSHCKRNLGSIGDYRCQKCGVATTFESSNCPNCGEEKGNSNSSGGYRRLDMS
ncbi:zinc-ribbon domain-containing protein [Encephalitozoon hellem]|uniref:Zinc-ribbon-like protein n=1 Tax=Encephalitozoon hellem TaxID=27973 RepID=A0ABY8CI65_ENCHE|nr:zinc-ribbon domain-containing protein [Encephalitozoon hellem]WEL38568.1 zinc-ribbon-like protein [Encephalitozoon hellem]